MSDRPRIDIGLDDDLPRPPRIKRTIDREALREASQAHGFDRPVSRAETAPAATPPVAAPPAAVDGRTLRATGRTAQMNAKVRPEVRDAFQRMSVDTNLSIGQLLERAIDLLKAERAENPQG